MNNKGVASLIVVMVRPPRCLTCERKAKKPPSTSLKFRDVAVCQKRHFGMAAQCPPFPRKPLPEPSLRCAITVFSTSNPAPEGGSLFSETTVRKELALGPKYAHIVEYADPGVDADRSEANRRPANHVERATCGIGVVVAAIARMVD